MVTRMPGPGVRAVCQRRDQARPLPDNFTGERSVPPGIDGSDVPCYVLLRGDIATVGTGAAIPLGAFRGLGTDIRSCPENTSPPILPGNSPDM